MALSQNGRQHTDVIKTCRCSNKSVLFVYTVVGWFYVSAIRDWHVLVYQSPVVHRVEGLA